MVQYVFYVDGVRDEHDEICVVEQAVAIFGTKQITISSLTAALTVCLSEDEDISPVSEQLRAKLAEQGYTIKLPPIQSLVESDVAMASSKVCQVQTPRQLRRVPLSVFISSVCAVLILAVLATYAVASELFHRELIEIRQEYWGSGLPSAGESDASDSLGSFYELEVLRFLFEQYAIEDIDEEALMNEVLKAYAASTGDIYAEYYTNEELEALNADNQGQMDGIGVSVVNDEVEINGFKYSVLTVISVFDGSPALESGVRVGDCIYTVVDGEGQTYTVDVLGYDSAIACVRGIAGTKAEFTVLRFDANGQYELLPFSITRAPITSESVRGHVLEGHPTIGLIKISQFDLTTPTQFKSTMDRLITQGCNQFIFDLRYNPGGALQSIEAVLSTLLNEGDLMISTVYKDGSEEYDYVRVVDYSEYEGYEGCSVTKEDIGKYRGYEFAVLTNEYTASAAELFTSNMRDYELATLIGVKTYGKGCMQTTFDLSYFGIEGGLKLTTAWYEPPSGENYHGVGIAPDIEVVMDAAVIEQYGNIYLIPDAEDAQLQAAIDALKQ